MPRSETFRVPADAYDRFVGRYGPQLGAALTEFAGVEPGMQALDVGCGPGALTAALVARLGAVNVSAADPSEPFAEACRSRLPGVEVLVAGAESLPFADGVFDATLSQLVVNFMDDAEVGVREMARVTRPGGVVASCVWDYAGEMTLLRAFWDAAREVDPERAAAEDEGAVMRWCGEGELEELWRDAGLSEVRFGPLTVQASYANFEDLWSPFLTGVGPAGAFCKSTDNEGRTALHDAYRRRLGVGEEPFQLTARAWAVAGTRRRMTTASPEELFQQLHERWNARDADGFAALFEVEGHSIGFDGSEMHGRQEIASELGRIFADHETAAYVAKIRDVHILGPDLALLRAVVGMVSPGKADLNPDVNAIQTLLATRTAAGWRISLLQNTPAQYHGRPEVAEALTAELRALL